MNIQLFNFLEDYNVQIVNLLKTEIGKNRPAYEEIPAASLQEMLERILDGYIDLLITGQSDALDKLSLSLLSTNLSRDLLH